MNINDYKYIYFLGIGGIGMSALARWFKAQGFVVGGYDKTQTVLTIQLESEGMDIHYDNKVGRIPTLYYNKPQTLVIYTPAIPKDNVEYTYFLDSKYVIMKRSQILGLISKSYKTIAVAGTHGKTTTSTMIAHVLKYSGLPISAFLGGISTNYETNLLIGDPSGWVVIEADEYDRSFLTLYPDITVVTSTDADHLDIYGDHNSLINSFNKFVGQLKPNGTFFHCHGLSFNTTNKAQTYGIDNGNIKATNIRADKGAFLFDFEKGNIVIKDIRLHIPGFHNVENATAAIAVALQVGITPEQAKAGIEFFKGVKRRFEYIYQSEKYIQIDDYAHHPTEIEAFLKSVKKLFPDKKLTCVFQPHLYSRTRDFAAGFSSSLSLADEVILMDIYPARELPMAGVNSEMLFDNIKSASKILCTKANVIEIVEKLNPELLVTVGAGDIDTIVQPIRKMMTKDVN